MQEPNHAAAVPDWFVPALTRLLPRGGGAGQLDLQPLTGAGNNRVFRLRRGDEVYFVKWYFSDREDPRDRLSSEWEFSRFAWDHGVREIPAPIAADASRQLAIYEFVPGRGFVASEVNQHHVRAAIDFFCHINGHRHVSAARKLFSASEACFTWPAHFECVDRRVQRLQACAKSYTKGTVAHALLGQLLPKAWERVIEQLNELADAEWNSANVELSPEEQVLSPSDFGFHNALLESNGQVRFLDFEYAGWDDPAKTICDFFCQVAIPVPREFWSVFTAGISEHVDGESIRRAQVLLPLYQIKWCCIVLNPILPVGRRRRGFANPGDAESETRLEKACVEKARSLLQELP